jgi:hypothetical protein
MLQLLRNNEHDQENSMMWFWADRNKNISSNVRLFYTWNTDPFAPLILETLITAA